MDHEAQEDGVPSAGLPPLDLERFRARRVRAKIRELAGALLIAIQRRDPQGLWDVLDEPGAMRWLPRGVREEALAMVRLPSSSHRAPIRLYRFLEQLMRLEDEPLPRGDPMQLELGVQTMPDAGRRRPSPRRRRTGGP